MAVLIKEVKVLNFRSCKETSLVLRPYTALIGYNNAGKSNIILAINWLLDGYFIADDDLFDTTNPVIVEASVIGIDEDALSLISEENRTKLEKFIDDGVLNFRRIQEKDTNGKVKKSIQLKQGGEWKKNPGGIDGAISNIFPEPIHIPAMSDAVEDATKSKSSTTIGKLLSLIVAEIKKEHETKFNAAIMEIDKFLSYNGHDRLNGLNDIDNDLNAKINEFFHDVNVKLHFPTPSLEDIFKSGTLKIFEKSSCGETMRDISKFGHGTQRSIQMALIQYLADRKQSSIGRKKSNTLIFIDEPELYLHPSAIHAIRDSLVLLSRAGFQVIITTHSASMISYKHAADAVQVYKDATLGTISRRTLSEKIEELYQASSAQLYSAFTLNNASQILFSEEVFLVEGKTEINVLPAIYNRFKGRNLDLSKKAFVSVNGKGSIFGMAEVISAVGIKTRVLVDCDFLGIYFNHPTTKDKIIKEKEEFELSLKKALESNELILKKPFKSLKCLKSYSSEDFLMLCECKSMQPILYAIHDKLKSEGIFFWKLGDIECVYGVKKSHAGWEQLTVDLQDEQKDIQTIIKNHEHMAEFVDWL